MRNYLMLAFVFVYVSLPTPQTNAEKAIPIQSSEIGSVYRVIGRTGEELGRMVTLEGVVIQGRGLVMGSFSGPGIQVQKINGRATQKCIELPIRPHSTGFGEPHYDTKLEIDFTRPLKPNPEWSLPKLEFGETYQFWGYETGGFKNGPQEAGSGLLQQSGFYFATVFVVARGKKISPIVFTPNDFIGQRVLMHGQAANHDGKAWLTGTDWQIEVLRSGEWPASLSNTRIKVIGEIKKAPNDDHLLVKECQIWHDGLADQIGKRVILRGEARLSNSFWWIRHNGKVVCVENMNHLVAGNSLDFYAPIQISGILCKELLSNDRFDKKDTEQYIVRDAVCRSIDDLLEIELVEEPCPWSIGLSVLKLKGTISEKPTGDQHKGISGHKE